MGPDRGQCFLALVVHCAELRYLGYAEFAVGPVKKG
jgi:hypothetical protein